MLSSAIQGSIPNDTNKTAKGQTLGDRTHELGLGETELEGFETLASLLLQLSNT
jgi:hypothetical protein